MSPRIGLHCLILNCGVGVGVFDIGVQLQRGQRQNFSSDHNTMEKTFDWSRVSKKCRIQIFHLFGYVTTNWLIFQKTPLIKLMWLLEWSCPGHNSMNQAKNPECQTGRVDIVLWSSVYCDDSWWYQWRGWWWWCLHFFMSGLSSCVCLLRELPLDALITL